MLKAVQIMDEETGTCNVRATKEYIYAWIPNLPACMWTHNGEEEIRGLHVYCMLQ